MMWRAAAGVALAVGMAGCGWFSHRPERIPAEPGATQDGIASWYGPGFHGRQTSSGEVYDQYAMTAAHQTLPHGTRVRVTNLTNDRAVVVRINDRGPFVDDRVIDLSYAAAQRIDMVGPGTAPVRLEVLDPNTPLLLVGAERPSNSRQAVAAPRPTAGTQTVSVRDVSAIVPNGGRGTRAPGAMAAQRYSVQVGTYSNFERARRAQQSLGSESVGAHLALIDAPDARYYQVRVGPFPSQEDASRAARRIVDLGFPALVVAH